MTERRRPRPAPVALLLAGLALAALAMPSAAAANEFPSGDAGYHTYTEVGADAAAVAAAHPDIVKRFSIGKSYKGRELWAVKISDNVNVDEPEPEVLFDGGHHADEHMGVEMTLKIMHWLADGYGKDTRITNIVNSREIWIILLVNPDGAEYDIIGGKYHFWRKNRQPTPGSTAIGTDLNRNYGYRWGTKANTSTNPFAITYRGPKAFSAPETRAVRDFLASRVVDGRQQIRAGITFHEYGRLVMWPYGYTYVDVPPDMTVDDHKALVAIGKKMAASNGYKPEQASDLYLTSGTSRDFAYGTYRIFMYTFELSVRDYPDDSLIAGETGRNKEAVLYLAEKADCPLAVLGAPARTARCGAFDDDLEVNRGWKVNPDGTDTATSGAFARANPEATSSSGAKQLGTVTSGSAALVTGAAAGASAGANDLDGRTSVRSGPITLPAASGQRLTFRYVFAHDANAGLRDRFAAIVEAEDGSLETVLLRLATPVDRDGVWRSASISLDPWAGETIHLRFVAIDGGTSNLVEVEIDDVRVTRPA
ncbi:MAG TPA: M14 family metallopeptidase [Candidatus Limnocylindrales bacterium]|nr:M14 family metallopeptidase [Candidatus Limnocylindrales bacterium]